MYLALFLLVLLMVWMVVFSGMFAQPKVLPIRVRSNTPRIRRKPPPF